MLTLKLTLYFFDKHSGLVVSTGFRVFDYRSYGLAITSVMAGCFGRRSKSAFFLEGMVNSSEQDVEPRWVAFKAALLSRDDQKWFPALTPEFFSPHEW